MNRLKRKGTMLALSVAAVGSLLPTGVAFASGNASTKTVSITFSIPYGNPNDVNPISGLGSRRVRR